MSEHETPPGTGDTPTPRTTAARRVNRLDPALPRYVVPVELAEELERELNAAITDTQRLDWLLKQDYEIIETATGGNAWSLDFLYPVITEDSSETLRSAIDAAMSAAEKQG